MIAMTFLRVLPLALAVAVFAHWFTSPVTAFWGGSVPPGTAPLAIAVAVSVAAARLLRPRAPA
jgi:hypothetical protein